MRGRRWTSPPRERLTLLQRFQAEAAILATGSERARIGARHAFYDNYSFVYNPGRTLR